MYHQYLFINSTVKVNSNNNDDNDDDTNDDGDDGNEDGDVDNVDSERTNELVRKLRLEGL